jgi:O-antigen/teichoic acid export membrane protein
VFPVLSVYYRESPDRVRPAVNQFFRTLAMVGLPTSVGTFMLTPGLNGLLHLFPQSEPALRILALGIFFMFISNTFIAALNAIDKQALFTLAAGASLVINVVLNIALIPTLGYIGASWATVLTEVGLTVMGYILVARHLGRVPVPQLAWRILAAGAVMGVLLYPIRGVHGWLTLAAVVGAALVYFGCLVAFRAVEPRELRAAAVALRLPFM